MGLPALQVEGQPSTDRHPLPPASTTRRIPSVLTTSLTTLASTLKDLHTSYAWGWVQSTCLPCSN
jgi:hypothetical protein